ncbi:MAG: response regulator [Gammaproteobacteria bacterium]|nr:response regulator [Gammaproteobacteria bacterium]
MMSEPTVFIIDDDPAVARSLRWLIEAVKLKVELFTSAQTFLDTYEETTPGCMLLDVRIPGLSGLELQEQLAKRYAYHVPIIFVTGHGDVKMAVRAIQVGAFDFVEKPFRDQELLDKIQRAIIFDAEQRGKVAKQVEITELISTLSPREREVFDLVAEGMSNKAIAYTLELSSKTVEAHRAKVMEKLHAKSLADLVKLSMQLRVNTP